MKDFATKRESLSGESGAGRPAREVISVGEACEMLGISRSTLYKLIRIGQIPAFKLSQGGRWRFKRGDLEAWLEDRKSVEILDVGEMG